MTDAASLPLAQPRRDDLDHRRIALLATASIEISPRDEFAGDRMGDLLATGRTVFVNHPGSVTHHDVVAACTRLRRAGFVPVPHVAARRLASFTQANDFLRRAAGEAAVDEALLIGGDPAAPAGPFRDSSDLLASGVCEGNGLHHVVFAGYPEGHPQIAARTLDAALRGKIALARRVGLEVGLITQFGFDAAPILGWVAAIRGRGIDCPIRIGVAGPASIATLAKYAVRCGIGGSLRALARGHTAFARMLTETNNDALIAALLARAPAAPGIDALHVFTFGGLRRTADWLRPKP
jgi:methylenetetrahydrofolate reductase (NADPH)